MGGGASRAFNIAEGLSAADCDVTVLTAFPHYPNGNVPKKYRRKLIAVENEEKFKVIRTFVPPIASKGVANRLLLFLSFAFSSLFALPLIRKINIVWAANPNIIAVFPSLVYKITNRGRIVQNVDDLWPEALYDLGLDQRSFLGRLGEFIAKIAYKLSSGVTPISPGYLPILLKKYGVEREFTFVVPAGVDLTKFKLMKKSSQGRDRFKVLYIGAFSRAYDFNQVLRAAGLLSCYSNVDFIIQGGGELANELECRAKAAKLRNVQIINKIVSRDEVAEIMAGSDALLLPLNGIGSIETGISSKLYEYQAAGKPILCCSSGQPGQYILHTKSGLVTMPGDHKMLTGAVVSLIKNPRLAQELGSAGRKYVEENMSIEKVGKLMKHVFEKIQSR